MSKTFEDVFDEQMDEATDIAYAAGTNDESYIINDQYNAILAAHNADIEAVRREEYERGVNDLSAAITSQLPAISAWDGQEARNNSMVHKLVVQAICSLEAQLTTPKEESDE